MFEFDDYIMEVNNNYWEEEQEMKLDIHPSQIIERAYNVLKESGITNTITRMDYGFSGTRVGVWVLEKFYGVFDYTRNVFESTPDSRLTETLEVLEMGVKNKC